ncbi:hypothetical protein DFQ30_010914 [Apophysomyces sp. BC1015]|nr:hypothetical protein DFQ30_010914 [Apophysomyces sp. BC1015]
MLYTSSLSLSPVLIEVQQTVDMKFMRRDRTIGLLYQLAKGIFEDECAVEKDKLDVLFDVCDRMEGQMEKIIASAGDPDQQSNSRPISHAENALLYLQTCKRKYQSIDPSSPASPMLEPKDLPEKAKRRQGGPKKNDLLPGAEKHSTSDLLFAETFMANLATRSISNTTTIDIPEAATSTTPIHEDTNSSDDTCFEVDNKFVIVSADIDEDPWILQNTDITRLFKTYQAAVRGIILKHETLPVESYTHELAFLTHVLILCKNQHRIIADGIFSLDLLKKLAAPLTLECINMNLDFPHQHFMTITTSITNLSLSDTTREQIILDFTIMATTTDYGPRRILRGINL